MFKTNKPWMMVPARKALDEIPVCQAVVQSQPM
jgi:hypothetical protein